MYKCIGIGRFFRLLLLDALVFFLCAGFFFIGRSLFRSSAENKTEAPVPLPAVMYHSVCERPQEDYIVTPDQLESDLKWLSDHGFTSVSAQQLIEYTRGMGELPEKAVLITFDDGFYNNASLALPLLEKYDMCAIVSIVGRYTDDYAPADPHADAYSYMTWEDISQLASSGRVEMGSHTYDMHSRSGLRQGCTKLPDENTEEYMSVLGTDIGLLRTELMENCGISPVVFAYPFGCISRESLPVLRENGILMTLTCREGMNFITRDSDCLYGIFRMNRSGFYSTEEYMERLTKDIPAS